jgi:hypothetical protein
MDNQTLYTKLATVPPPIKSWLGSDTVIDTIDALEEKLHLPKGSASVIAKLIQRIQIKDLGVEYFAGELALELKLEKQTALLIAQTVKKDIFSAKKQDWADYGIDISLLEKFETPIASPAAPTTAPGPKMIQDLGIPTPPKPAATISLKIPVPTVPTPPPQPAPKVSTQVGQGLTVGISPISGVKPGATTTSIPPAPSTAPKPPMPPTSPAQTPPAPPKSAISSVGWSKLTPEAPVVKLNTVVSTVIPPSMKPATPAPTAAVPVAPTTPAVNAGRGMSEFERMDMMKKGTSAPMPPPVMLHEVQSSAPLSKSSDLHFSIAPRNEMKIPLSQQASQVPLPPKAAVLELGKMPTPSKTVNYSGSAMPKPPTPPTTTVSGERHVTELTASSQATPTLKSVTMPPPAPPKQ